MPRVSIEWPPPLCRRKRCLDAMRGFGERAVDVAVVDALPRDEIVRAIEPRLGRAGAKPRDRIGHRRQFLEIERDQRQRVLGDAAAVGHHHRDRLADIGDLVLGQHIRDRHGSGSRRTAAPAGCGRRSAAAADRRKSAPRARRAGLWPRWRRCLQPAMRHRAAQERDMQRARDIEIVDEAALAAQQRRVLDARRCGGRPKEIAGRFLLPSPLWGGPGGGVCGK